MLRRGQNSLPNLKGTVSLSCMRRVLSVSKVTSTVRFKFFSRV